MTYPHITPEYIAARIEQWEKMLLVAEDDVYRATTLLKKWRNYEPEEDQAA